MRKSSYKMSSCYLEVAEVRERITAIWSSRRPGGFFSKLRQVVHFYKGYCLQSAKAQREAEAHLRAQLSDAVEALQADPGNTEIQSRLSNLGEQVGEVEKHLVEGLKVRNGIRWKHVGDACTRDFFQAHKDRGDGAKITELEDSAGRIFSDQADLERICAE